MKKKAGESKPLARIYKSFISPHKIWLIIRIAGAILSAAVDITMAYIIVQIVDNALAADMDNLKRGLTVLLIMVFAGILASFINRYSSGRLGAKTVKSIRTAIGSHTPELKVSYMDTRNSGKEISKLTAAIAGIQNYIENDLPNIIFQPLRFLGAFVFMLLINWKMLLVCVVTIPLMMIAAEAITKPIRKLSESMQEKTAFTNSILQDALGGMQILRAYNLKDILFGYYHQAIDNSVKDSLAIERRRSMLTPLIVLTQLLPFSLCFAYGGYLSVQGQLTTGELVSFVELMNYIVMPAVFIPRLLANSQSTAGTAAHIFELLDAETERKGGIAGDPEEVKEAVRFNAVSFGYNGEDDTVKNISFSLPKNSLTALVGHSGSGKSTLLKLICGFYEPSEGSVEIFGTDMRQWDLEEMRAQIAVVSQNTYLFPVSIAENISYGRPDASREEIIEAAKAAGAHDFIMELPDKYETVVQERGEGLSGGQRQRISIARALISKSPILLFDEPSSALDRETEKYIQEEMKRLSADHTLLVSAHRLSITKDADNIIVLNKGEINGIGAHESLIQENEVYRELYLRQEEAEGHETAEEVLQ